MTRSLYTHCTMGFALQKSSLLRIWPNWLLLLPFSKLRVISDEIFGVPCSFSFTFFHIFDSPFTFSWVLIISDKLKWPRKGNWGTSWILPSKSGSKCFWKNIMTENIWNIFAPWRGPQIKLLFSTFFKSRSIWLTHKILELAGDPFMFFANISANIGHIWSKKYLP